MGILQSALRSGSFTGGRSQRFFIRGPTVRHITHSIEQRCFSVFVIHFVSSSPPCPKCPTDFLGLQYQMISIRSTTACCPFEKIFSTYHYTILQYNDYMYAIYPLSAQSLELRFYRSSWLCAPAIQRVCERSLGERTGCGRGIHSHVTSVMLLRRTRC